MKVRLETETFRYSFGETGPGVGQLDDPIALAVDESGRVYVTDRENNRVSVWRIDLQPSSCDFDGNNLCDLNDLDRLYDDIAAGTLGGPTDLDGNGLVDNDDIDEWLSLAGTENGKSYLPGDTDLNGEVGGTDFTALSLNFGNIGTDPNAASAYWRHGNFDGKNSNGNFDVGGPDFTALALNFGHVSVQAVPEPEGLGWLFLGWMVWCAGHRRMGR